MGLPHRHLKPSWSNIVLNYFQPNKAGHHEP